MPGLLQSSPPLRREAGVESSAPALIGQRLAQIPHADCRGRCGAGSAMVPPSPPLQRAPMAVPGPLMSPQAAAALPCPRPGLAGSTQRAPKTRPPARCIQRSGFNTSPRAALPPDSFLRARQVGASLGSPHGRGACTGGDLGFWGEGWAGGGVGGGRLGCSATTLGCRQLGCRQLIP